MAICLSHSGVSSYASGTRSNELYVGTTDGISLLKRGADGQWKAEAQLLGGYHICSLSIEPETGTMLVGTHNGGFAVSTDQGATWEFRNDGLAATNVFSVASSKVGDEIRVYCGIEPAHLYVSKDFGKSWTELDGLRNAPNIDDWTFPPPPHEAHVKHIIFDPSEPETIYACVEQGELLRSTDGGVTWEDMLSRAGVCDEAEGDAHRVVMRPSKPNELFMPTGFGLFFSDDKGASWKNIKERTPWIGYPDPMVYDPNREDVMFVAGGRRNPGFWIAKQNASASIARTIDGGQNWELAMGGLPENFTASIEAMCLDSYEGGCAVYLGTTDGDVFCSDNDGETWSKIVSGLPPVSKGVHWMLVQGKMGGPPPQ